MESGAQAIAGNVRRLMDQRGWTQRELARRSGVSQSGVGYLLRYKDSGDRHPTTETVDAIARAFGIQPWLLWIPDVSTETFSLRQTEQSSLARSIATGTWSSDRTSQRLGLDRAILKRAVETLDKTIAAHESWLPPEEYAGFVVELYELLQDDLTAALDKVVDINEYMARRALQGSSKDGRASQNRRDRKTS